MAPRMTRSIWTCLSFVQCNAHQRPQFRAFSVLNRPEPNYEGHVFLTAPERVALGVGAAAFSLLDPHRGDLIAALGEATAVPYFIYRLRDAMLSDPTGRRILRDRPRINSQNMGIARLEKCPPGSVGIAYLEWLQRERVTPDTRAAVRYIDNEECAYVMQRYRECHDFTHAICGLPTFVEGEVALKAFEFANTLLPMTGISLFALLRMKSSQRDRFWRIYLPWALSNGIRSRELINVYWEEHLDCNAEEMRRLLHIERPPDLRQIRSEAKKSRGI